MYLSDLQSSNLNTVDKECGGKYYPYIIDGATHNLEFKLGGKYCSFYSDVTVYNYDNLDDDFSVDFYVYADGRLVAYTPNVHIGAVNPTITANIYNAQILHLKTVTHGNKTQGNVAWLNPQVDTTLSTVVAALNDITIVPPTVIKHADTCIVTVTDVNFIHRVDAMLYSLRENGQCDDAAIVVFAFGEQEAYKELVDKYDIVLVQCALDADFSYKIKTAAMSVARVIDANKYLYLDSDMLILDDISPLFGSLDIIADDKILVCKEASVDSPTLEHALCDPSGVYYAQNGDLDFLGMSASERNYPFVVNNGVYCGSKKAILALESLVKSTLPNSAYWEKFAISSKVFWREQAVFNIALARGSMGVEISELYNMQLHTRVVSAQYMPYVPDITYCGEKVKILHFNGSGREKYVETQQYYNDKCSLVSLPDNDLKLYLDTVSAELHSVAKRYFSLIKDYININTVKQVLVIGNDVLMAENIFGSEINVIAVPDTDIFVDSSSDFVVPQDLDMILIDGYEETQIFTIVMRSVNVIRIGGCIILKNNKISTKVMRKIFEIRGINIITINNYYAITKFGDK